MKDILTIAKRCEMPKFGDEEQCEEQSVDYVDLELAGPETKTTYRIHICEHHYYEILRMGKIGMYRLWETNKLFGHLLEGED